MVTLSLPLSPVLDFGDYPAGCRPVDSDRRPTGAVVVFVIGLADDPPAECQRTLTVTPDFVVCVFMLAHSF
jgi:hypothetical protein